MDGVESSCACTLLALLPRGNFGGVERGVPVSIACNLDLLWGLGDVRLIEGERRDAEGDLERELGINGTAVDLRGGVMDVMRALGRGEENASS